MFAAYSELQTITIKIQGDTLYEGPETFSVDLMDPVHATIENGQGISNQLTSTS